MSAVFLMHSPTGVLVYRFPCPPSTIQNVTETNDVGTFHNLPAPLGFHTRVILPLSSIP